MRGGVSGARKMMTRPSGVRLAASEREEEWGLVVSDRVGSFRGEKMFRGREGEVGREWA